MKTEKKLTVMENMVWNTVGSFTYLICQWLLTFILVRCFDDVDGAGQLSLAMSITNIFYTLAHFNVRSYLISDIQGNFKIPEYSAFRLLTCGFSITACYIYISCFGYNREQFFCILFYMIFRLGEAWVDLLHGMEQRRSRMDIGGLSLFVRGILLIVSFVTVFYFTDNFNLSILAMAVSTWSYILLADVSFAKKFEDFRPAFSWEKMKSMMGIFLLVTTASFLGLIASNFPRQILESRMGSEILGIYSTVATPAVIVQVAATYVFNPVLTEFAVLYNHKDSKDRFTKFVLKIIGILVALSVVCLVGAAALGEWGLNLLYGQRIAEHAYLFMPVICYTCLNAFVWFLWNLLIVIRRLKSLLVVNSIGLVICFLLIHPMITVFSMNGVSYTLIIYSVVVISLMLGVLLF